MQIPKEIIVNRYWRCHHHFFDSSDDFHIIHLLMGTNWEHHNTNHMGVFLIIHRVAFYSAKIYPKMAKHRNNDYLLVSIIPRLIASCSRSLILVLPSTVALRYSFVQWPCWKFQWSLPFGESPPWSLHLPFSIPCFWQWASLPLSLAPQSILCSQWILSE